MINKEMILNTLKKKDIEDMKNNSQNFLRLDNRIFLLICQLGISVAVVYIGIRRHLNDNTGKCYPSNRLLQKELNVSDKTITKAVKILKENGFIKVKVGRGGCYYYEFPDVPNPKNFVAGISDEELIALTEEEDGDCYEEEEEYYEEIN